MCTSHIHLRKPLTKLCEDLTQCSSKVHIPCLTSIFLSKTKPTEKAFLNRLNLKSLVTVYNQTPWERLTVSTKMEKNKMDTILISIIWIKWLFILKRNKTKGALILSLLSGKNDFYDSDELKLIGSYLYSIKKHYLY